MPYIIIQMLVGKMSEQELSEDDRWARDIRLSHIHGMLIGMRKNLSFEDFQKYWFNLLAISGEQKKLNVIDSDYDKELLKTLKELHMNIIDGVLTLSKDDEITNKNKNTLIELANMIIQEEKAQQKDTTVSSK